MRTHAHNYTHFVMIPFHAIFPLTALSTQCSYNYSTVGVLLYIMLSNTIQTADIQGGGECTWEKPWNMREQEQEQMKKKLHREEFQIKKQ